ncbi:MAG: ATP-binding cassette domain-containing protein [Candidatus Paceibacterota bacterium]
MSNGNVILKFTDVSFEYGHNKPILNEANFSLRRGSKIVLMGQNGAGKSTLFKLIAGKLKPEDGSVSIDKKATIAIAEQVIPKDKLDLKIKEYFESLFTEKVYDIDPRIAKVFDAVNLQVPTDRKLKELSGGQQARILLASALIKNPDILLLDEPTNNLDVEGLKHLTQFLVEYPKTCLVISHDAEFLNAFTDGVLYLDIFTKKLEKFDGNYNDVVNEIAAKQDRERRQRAKAEKEIQERKDKANFFAQKGGKMRVVAKKMRDRVEELEEGMGEATREDKTIRPFSIPPQEGLESLIATISSVSVIQKDKIVEKKLELGLHKKEKILLSGPNGIGKTTWLERIANNEAKGVKIEEE